MLNGTSIYHGDEKLVLYGGVTPHHTNTHTQIQIRLTKKNVTVNNFYNSFILPNCPLFPKQFICYLAEIAPMQLVFVEFQRRDKLAPKVH